MRFYSNKKPNIVTRFINEKKRINFVNKKANFSAFYRKKDLSEGEISVFDIDDLLNGDAENIFLFGDKKVCKKDKSIARADLNVKDVEKIKYNQFENLKVQAELFTKHCAIKPFPNNELQAQNLATNLAFIANLHLRDNKV